MVNREVVTAKEPFYRSPMATSDAAMTIDADGRIVLANNQAERLFGYGPGELVGLSVEDLLPDRRRSRHTAHWTTFLATSKLRLLGVEQELVARRKDGSVFPSEISFSPITTDEDLLVIATVREVTDRKEKKAAPRSS